MKLPRNLRIFRGQLDAAPFVSVWFLLLIFFILQSKLVFNPGVRFNLQPADSEQPVRLDLPPGTPKLAGTENLTVVVAIDNSGQFYYEGRLVPLDRLIQALTRVVQDSVVPITLEVRADQSSKLNATFQLSARAGQIGFKEVIVVARPPLAPVPPSKASAR